MATKRKPLSSSARQPTPRARKAAKAKPKKLETASRAALAAWRTAYVELLASHLADAAPKNAEIVRGVHEWFKRPNASPVDDLVYSLMHQRLVVELFEQYTHVWDRDSLVWVSKAEMPGKFKDLMEWC